MGKEEAERFDATVRKVLSVSREELNRREEEWKRQRANEKPRGRKPAPPKPPTAPTPATSEEEGRARGKEAADALNKLFKDNPDYEVPY